MSRDDDEWAGWARDFQGSAAEGDAATPAAMRARILSPATVTATLAVTAMAVISNRRPPMC